MNPCVHHEPDRAKKLGLQTPEIAERIALVPTSLFRQPFCVERPTFLIRGERNQLPELRQALYPCAIETCQ